jgi:FSR family fosmidomycin resistance protein-like MFS transporter
MLFQGDFMSIGAVTKAPTTEEKEFQADRVITISAGHAMHDTYTAFLAPLLPVFKESLALSNAQLGWLTVFNQIASLLQPAIGHLADRKNLRLLVILTPAVTATTMSLLGIAPTYAVLAVLLLAAGLSSATLHSVAPVIAGRLSGRNLGRGMGIWMLGGELGRFLGPLVIGTYFLLRPDSLHSLPLLMFGGWLASVLLYVRLRDVEWRPSDSENGLPWQQALRSMGPFLVPLIAIIAVRAFMSAVLTTYLPVFLVDEGAAAATASFSLSVLEAAGVIGALLGGSLSDRLGRRMTLFLSLVTTPPLMLAFLFLDGWLRWPLLLLLGLSALSVVPVLMALVQESFPESRALANGVYMALNFGIRAGVVVVVGTMGDLWGMRLAFLVSAVIPLLGLPFLRLFPAQRG